MYCRWTGDAYSQAATGQTILIQSYELGEDLSLTLDKEWLLKGSYDYGFTTNTGSLSLVRGSLMINAGRVTFDKVAVK